MQLQSIEVIARFGYVARGIVYILIGGLALAAALALGGQTEGSRGALATLAGEPLGTAALLMVGLGLFGYSLWRLVQSVLDADRLGRDAKGLAVRAGLLVSAVTHVLLGIYAISLAFGTSGGSNNGSQGAAAWVMQQPFGRYLLGAIAVAIAGAGFAQIWKGWKGKFRKRLDMPHRLEGKLAPVCAFGLVARGITFLIIGSFFFYAALTVDPDQAGGLDSALEWLRSQSYGGILFGVIAAGLLAFGIYSLIEARFRRIDTGEPQRQARATERTVKRAIR